MPKSKVRILNQALEHASKGIVIQDTDRNIVFVNHACEEITKWPKGEMVGKHCSDAFQCHASTGTSLVERICPCVDVLSGRFSQNARELLIYRGDGSECWVEMSASAIKNDDGVITHTITIVEDVGARKIFFDEIIKSKTVSTLGAFASEVTHEIKNFLNAVNIHIFMLKSEIKNLGAISDETKQEIVEIVRMVQRGIDRLSEFAQGCMRISNSGSLDKRPVAIDEMLDEVFSLVSPRALLSGICIELDIARDIPLIVVDRDKMKQVIMNILLNGMDDMKGGGRLAIEAKHSGREVRLICQDDGPGVSEEIKNKIFDLIYTDKGGITKIGLASAQNIIHAHSGTIRLESSAKGNRFIITIPTG